jgi:hypothetical protein
VLIGLGGLSMALGGALATAGWLLFARLDPGHQEPAHARWLPLNGLIMAGGLLMALGLPGFYLGQAERSGLPGLIGFLSLFAGICVSHLSVHAIETATMPEVPDRMMLWIRFAEPALFVGASLTGLTTVLAGVTSAWAGGMLVLAAVLGLAARLVPMPPWLGRNVISAVGSGAMLWLGCTMILA